jgi:para-aminobenzoate synthetase component 1
VARLEWRYGDLGDPAELLESFLAGYGISVRDLSTRQSSEGEAGRQSSHGDTPGAPSVPGGRAHRICGAAVLIGAAAAARMVEAPAAPTPTGAVPDLVAVVYEHTDGLPAIRSVRHTGWRLGPWQPSWDRRAQLAAIGAVRRSIACGDVYQVTLVGHAIAEYVGDPVPALRRVAGLAGARYGGVLAGAGWAVACASPETLVEVYAGAVRTRPIKGTRPATRTGRAQLRSSAKERAEHIMIVDLERNDLARVADTGSVHVEELYAIRSWCGLLHAESVVRARLARGVGLAELLRAVCPGGSVTGAPKLAALDLIADLEPVGRGPSMGAIGWVGHDRIDLGLTIRTVAAADDRLHVWTGGGITWSSEPAAEVAEAAAKAAPLRAALAG